MSRTLKHTPVSDIQTKLSLRDFLRISIRFAHLIIILIMFPNLFKKKQMILTLFMHSYQLKKVVKISKSFIKNKKFYFA